MDKIAEGGCREKERKMSEKERNEWKKKERYCSAETRRRKKGDFPWHSRLSWRKDASGQTGDEKIKVR